MVTRKTKISLALWGLFIFIVILTPRILRNLIPDQPIELTVQQQQEIQEMITTNQQPKKHFFTRKKYRRPPHLFNPNQYTLEDWKSLGLSEKQASAVLKFCRFPLKSNADLKKIFIIPDELYQLIKDSTIYEPAPSYEIKPKEGFNKKETQTEPIQMVHLDSARLVALPGIGPFYAKMVMKYEKALGGFHAKEQLLEVYKMNEEVYEILCQHLNFNQPNIRKISINQATKEELAKHPYIDNWQANSIIKMRKQLGGFQSLRELLDSHLINTETFEKILPYVSL
jgi:DNA uptake protein ComE-like DNA-binding protein